ncbi:hypothetical protein J7T55_009711 [Diaporthe amygdali]|uniref:uncharacterized protein n=1 Tax=Phomopsis amygdali TaxID=1214568 RepID=UPI0022FDE425|nr:uncharacterized protein J7T55_009711 [Diaporthe amygdali]KAJ0104046.1 hypothetical protein J7T55_009711 [Diaporthe amygdali]
MIASSGAGGVYDPETGLRAWARLSVSPDGHAVSLAESVVMDESLSQWNDRLQQSVIYQLPPYVLNEAITSCQPHVVLFSNWLMGTHPLGFMVWANNFFGE